jgi:hypothetical protein
MTFTSIQRAYNQDFHGLALGGLGETVLAAPLCFCVDKKTIKRYEKNAIRCHKGKCGVCARKTMCKHCIKHLRHVCKF